MGDSERPGRAGGETPGLVVPSAPCNIGVVRLFAVDACVARGWGQSAETVELLVSEVATNAVLHADGREIGVRVMDLCTRLRVEVDDGSPTHPTPRVALSEHQDGRGLALVDALARRWGVDKRHDGKTFWFEIGR